MHLLNIFWSISKLSTNIIKIVLAALGTSALRPGNYQNPGNTKRRGRFANRLRSFKFRNQSGLFSLGGACAGLHRHAGAHGSSPIAAQPRRCRLSP
jgi:hypothetical protein